MSPRARLARRRAAEATLFAPPSRRAAVLGSASRFLAALVLAALAAFALLLARDLRSWHAAVAAGDARFIQAPGSASWSASTVLPFDLAERVLGIAGQLRFRVAAQSFVPVHSLGLGLDNGYSESLARDGLEEQLEALTDGPSDLRDSEAENMLGILAYSDSRQNGVNAPAPVERSVSDFQSAVQLDPENDDAKFNLELLLQLLLAHGIRPGSSSGGGPATGHRGAGGATPGRGY